MKNLPFDIGHFRRQQVVDAAVAVIAEQGIQNLSLSEIEKKAGMSRGQLTYYFPAKEDILLAVFDRLLLLMYQRLGQPGGKPHPAAAEAECEQSGWAWVQHLFRALLLQPPLCPELGCLQYTFLSQIGHREDFRQRLARLYEEWRGHMAQGLASDLAQKPASRPVSPRALATLVQAILHGLGMQAAANPEAFDRREMLELCLGMLESYLWGHRPPATRRPARPRKKKAASGPARRSVTPAGRNGRKG